eukprot:353171-Chlamydomonas_euryale.AAC.14
MHGERATTHRHTPCDLLGPLAWQISCDMPHYRMHASTDRSRGQRQRMHATCSHPESHAEAGRVYSNAETAVCQRRHFALRIAFAAILSNQERRLVTHLGSRHAGPRNRRSLLGRQLLGRRRFFRRRRRLQGRFRLTLRCAASALCLGLPARVRALGRSDSGRAATATPVTAVGRGRRRRARAPVPVVRQLVVDDRLLRARIMCAQCSTRTQTTRQTQAARWGCLWGAGASQKEDQTCDSRGCAERSRHDGQGRRLLCMTRRGCADCADGIGTMVLLADYNAQANTSLRRRTTGRPPSPPPLCLHATAGWFESASTAAAAAAAATRQLPLARPHLQSLALLVLLALLADDDLRVEHALLLQLDRRLSVLLHKEKRGEGSGPGSRVGGSILAQGEASRRCPRRKARRENCATCR